MTDARTLIDRLALAPHPEGGWFRETHRSSVTIPPDALPAGYPGVRTAATCILFLLESGQSSRSHRVRSEEIWLHQGGDDLELTMRAPESQDSRSVVLGPGPGAAPQAVVPPGWWQAARPLAGRHGYVLVGCVVAPGFEFADFEMESE